MSASMFDPARRCRSCDEAYGPGCTVPASPRPGVCASCFEALGLQLTVDGREVPAPEPVQPETHEVLPLFNAPQTIRGQLPLEEVDDLRAI